MSIYTHRLPIGQICFLITLSITIALVTDDLDDDVIDDVDDLDTSRYTSTGGTWGMFTLTSVSFSSFRDEKGASSAS